jgi:hypothetical protein
MNDEPTFMKLSFPWAVPSSALDVCFHFVRGSKKMGNWMLCAVFGCFGLK